MFKNVKHNDVLLLTLLVIIVLGAYCQTLNFGFLGLDDDLLLTENSLVRSLSPHNIAAIFQQKIGFLYFPLTTLSFAVEYHFVQYQPYLYHFDNVLLHAAVVGLVFYLARRMGLKSSSSFFAALLFGLHPMHVESVAWVSERKDVLCAFFYMLALISYWKYISSLRRGAFMAAWILGLLSMLAKPMAFSLPFVFLLMDRFAQRAWSKKLILEKVIHGLYIIPVLAICSEGVFRFHFHELGSVSPISEKILIFVWSGIFYLIKFLFPVELLPMYQLPEPVNLLTPAYLLSFVAFLFVIVLLVIYRRAQWLLFAFGFYLLTIFPFLRFYDVQSLGNLNNVADRFMYIPSLGFCLMFGLTLGRVFDELYLKRLRAILVTLVMIIFSSLFVKTFEQVVVWRDDVSLWSYVIKNTPHELSYDHRGLAYKKQGEFDLALNDFNHALTLNPNFAEGYNNRGNLYAGLGQMNLAIDDYNKALSQKITFTETYRNRGIVYNHLGLEDLALKDFNKVISLSPSDGIAYHLRSAIYESKHELDKALEDASRAKALGVDPNDHYERLKTLKDSQAN